MTDNTQNISFPYPTAPPPPISQPNDDRIEQLLKVQLEALELFARKNADYGDAFATYRAVGVIVRMGDKISRLQSITNRQISLVNTESLRDTLIDLHNYSAMSIMLLDEDNYKIQSLVKNQNGDPSNPNNTPIQSPK